MSCQESPSSIRVVALGCRCARPRPLAVAALLLSSGLTAPALAADWSWTTGSGFWNTAANWAPATVPGFGPGQEGTIRIGNLPGASGGTVLLNHAVGLGALPFVDMYLSNGMVLDTNGREIGSLGGDLSLSGAGTGLIVRPSAGPNFYDLTAGRLLMGAGTQLDLQLGSHMRVGTAVTSLLTGRGTLHLQDYPGSPVALRNEGTINGLNNGGLTLLQEGKTRMDLDGFSGTGQILLASPFSQLTVQGDQLADSFSSQITIGTGSLLNMNMSGGWTADASSAINASSSVAGAAAQIGGGHVTLAGAINVGGSQGHLRVLAPATVQGTAVASVGTADTLEFDAATTVDGGNFQVAQGGRVRFDGPTTVRGGTFVTPGPETVSGSVDFHGATTWDGVVSMSGHARQLGPATVVGPTTINAGVFGMDGAGSTSWAINNSLVINADAIRSTGSLGFTGSMTVAGGAFGRLTMNMSNSPAWSLLGTMNLIGDPVLYPTRVAGDRFLLNGDLNVVSGRAQISADTNVGKLATVNIGPASAALRFSGDTYVNAEAEFSGQGTIVNGLTGTLRLARGTDFNGVGLVNAGQLQIGTSGTALTVGAATVARFENTAAGIWLVDLGGLIAGTQHDVLRVDGPGGATLAGTLDVALADLGSGLFQPAVGDEFTILRSLGGVVGTFANDPITQVGGLTYEWSLVYSANAVVLRLDSVVPTPGSAVLAGLGGLLLTRRRRA